MRIAFKTTKNKLQIKMGSCGRPQTANDTRSSHIHNVPYDSLGTVGWLRTNRSADLFVHQPVAIAFINGGRPFHGVERFADIPTVGGDFELHAALALVSCLHRANNTTKQRAQLPAFTRVAMPRPAGCCWRHRVL